MEIHDMIDIENVLYEGNKNEIEKILKEYEVSYRYDKANKNFSIKSLKLQEISRGYKTNIEPNCIKFFGNNYKNS